MTKDEYITAHLWTDFDTTDDDVEALEIAAKTERFGYPEIAAEMRAQLLATDDSQRRAAVKKLMQEHNYTEMEVMA